MVKPIKNKLLPPFKMHGGKYYLCDWIIGYFPANYEEYTYVETSGGAGNVILNKLSSVKDIYNDVDKNLYNAMHQIKTNSSVLYDLLKEIEYTKENFEKALLRREKAEGDDPNRCIDEIIARRMSRGGLRKKFSWSNRLRNHRPGEINAWENFKDNLLKISNKLQKVEIESMDQKELVLKYDSEKTLFYSDPPYLKGTRKTFGEYDHEMSDEEHIEWCELIKTLKGKVIISGYMSDVYQNILKDWNVKSKLVTNNASQKKSKNERTEILWINY
jgi:DNA adenine methylase